MTAEKKKKKRPIKESEKGIFFYKIG